MANSYDVIIVGAGVAGLRAALELSNKTSDILILESQQQVGGRVRTYERNGFLLDRGFQILLTGYPEAKHVLDYDGLNLGTFKSGALIRSGGQFQSLVDPLQHPFSGWRTLLSSVGSTLDKWKLFRLKQRLKKSEISEVLNRKEESTLEYLREFGFSDTFIDSFFRPFFSGIFLETDLATSSRMFEFVFKMFSQASAALPENGMQAIPDQMASRLDDGLFQFDTHVTSIENGTVRTESGDTVTAEAILCATDGTDGLIKETGSQDTREWNGTNCYYFSLEEPPRSEPILYLNADEGPITNLCFPSLIQQNYSPDNRHLLSVSTVRSPERSETVEEIRDNLMDWFGPQVSNWDLLGRYEIPRALPDYRPGTPDSEPASQRIETGLYVCGDRFRTPSLNGALQSGKQAAHLILEDLSLT
ncbi:MAG: FAD-dependent oxidoreductase [bacterium]